MENILISGSQLTACCSGGKSFLSFNEKSPKALETAKYPLTLEWYTLDPESTIRWASPFDVGLWSVV